jgi:hypothetical protein
MVATAVMLVVLVCGYVVMIALVTFAEHVIERPRLAKRDQRIARSSEKSVWH